MRPKSLKKQLLKTVIFTILLTTILPAQVLNFRNFGASEGLVQSQVFTILQDNDGYIWFGTVNGAARFDGRTFENFTVKDGLSANYIYAGLKDREGNLWFGHANGTVTKYEWASQKFSIISIVPTPNNTTVIINRIKEDQKGQIWFVASGQGVYYLTADSIQAIKTLGGLNSEYTNDWAEQTSGEIWFAHKKSISIYNPENGNIDYLQFREQFKNSEIKALLNDGNGNMWIGSSGDGALRYHIQSKKWKRFTKNEGLAGNSINSLYLDPQGRIWFNTEFNGLSFGYASSKGKIQFAKISKINGLAYNTINATFEDKEGNYWFGTNGRGVSQLRDRRFAVWAKSPEFKDPSTWAIVTDAENDVWVGLNRGLAKIDRRRKHTTFYRSYRNKKFGIVNRVTIDAGGDVWFLAHGQGIYRVSSKTGRLSAFKLQGSQKFTFNALEADHKNNIWFGTQFHGLFKYNLERQSVENFTRANSVLTTDSVYVMYHDDADKMWIGLINGGLFVFENDHLNKIPAPMSSIISIAGGTQGDYWFVDMQDQLFRYQNGVFTNYTNTSGLGRQALYSVIADTNGVWVGTSLGVARLGYQDSLFTHFGMKQGFPIAETNENAVFKGREGQLWFGTIDGAVCYYPKEERANLTPPSTSIRKIKLFYTKEISPAQVEFSANENHLTFDFIGISLSMPERVRYRYHLQGFDEEWSPETDFPSVTYSNIPPGDYTFQVIACNNDDLWNKEPVTYSFTILPPFWQTWWFTLLALFCFGVLIYLFVQWRTNKVNRMNVILGKKVEERTSELQKEKESAEQALAALKESENKFRTYTELTSSGIFIYQEDGFRYVNKACEEISGFTEKELLKRTVWDLVHPDFHDSLKKRFVERMSGKEVLNRYEFKAVHKDGSERWLDFSGLLINFNNRPALLATLVDITERKLAEQALMEEKERLAVTLRSIGDGVITAGMNGNVTLMNEQAKIILGFEDQPLKEARLEKMFMVFDEHSGRRLKDPVKEISENQGLEIPDKDCVLKTASGDQRFISVALSPLRDKYSQLIGVVLVIRDMTEKRQMEQELFKSQKLESVGVLAGGIAHDFNNILTAIIGNLSLAKLTLKPSDKTYERIEKAEKASVRAQDLTQQLLTFSKGGAPVKKVTSIREIISESVGFVLSGSNVKCNLNFSEDIPPIEVDAGQISQVIQNLAINADQAMPDGGSLDILVKQIELRKARKGLVPGSYVQIDIADQGIGIPKDYLDKIFDPFFTTKQSGSGLGLATSYSIIQKHGGVLAVQSALEKGTTFSIFLPVTAGVQIAEQEIRKDISDFKGSGRILVMDDETFIHETATSMLNSFGFDVEIAIDGDQALEKYKQSIDSGDTYKAVLMDLTIPGGMGGKIAIGKMLELDAKAKVVVSSGYSSDPVMSDFIQYGFKGCLKKPYRVTELINVLKDIEINN